MPKIEAAIGDPFNRAYAFLLGVAALVGAIVTLLQRYEAQWAPFLVGGLALIRMFIALVARPRKH